MSKISESKYSKAKGKRIMSIYYISISLIVLIIFAIASALIKIYIEIETLYLFGIPMDFRFFIYGIFTILYGILIFQLVRISGSFKEKTKKRRKRK